MNVKTLAWNIADLDDVQKLRLVGAVNEQNNDLYDYMNVVPFDDDGLELLLAHKSIPEIVRMSVFASGPANNTPFNYLDEYICIGDDGNLQSVSESYIQRMVDGEDELELAENVFSVLGADVDEDIDVGNLMARYLDLDSDIIEKLTRTERVGEKEAVGQKRRTAAVAGLEDEVRELLDEFDVDELIAVAHFLFEHGADVENLEQLQFEQMEELEYYLEGMSALEAVRIIYDHGDHEDEQGSYFDPYADYFTCVNKDWYTSYGVNAVYSKLLAYTEDFAAALVEMDKSKLDDVPEDNLRALLKGEQA